MSTPSSNTLDIPIVTMRNGLRVGNFSSPHTFTFNTGEVLAACSSERANALMLETEEVEVPSECGRWTDIQLKFKMSPAVLQAILEVDLAAMDILIVPLPVRRALDEFLGKDHTKEDREIFRRVCFRADICRVCRSADRVTKTIFSDRFCL